MLLLTHVNAALVIPGQETPADPPPMGVTFPLRRPLALMDKENPKIGWWDAEKGAWSQSGITEVQYDEDTNMISFFTTKLTSLALIQSRTQLFPYRGWFLRPVIKRFDPDFMAVELRLLCGLPMPSCTCTASLESYDTTVPAPRKEGSFTTGKAVARPPSAQLTKMPRRACDQSAMFHVQGVSIVALQTIVVSLRVEMKAACL